MAPPPLGTHTHIITRVAAKEESTLEGGGRGRHASGTNQKVSGRGVPARARAPLGRLSARARMHRRRRGRALAEALCWHATHTQPLTPPPATHTHTHTDTSRGNCTARRDHTHGALVAALATAILAGQAERSDAWARAWPWWRWSKKEQQQHRRAPAPGPLLIQRPGRAGATLLHRMVAPGWPVSVNLHKAQQGSKGKWTCSVTSGAGLTRTGG